MEALAALGIAGNVVQFVDFGIKTVKAARELYKSTEGTLKTLAEIEKQAVDQTCYFQSISKGGLSKDQELLKLRAECSSVSKDLIALIKSLQVDPQKNRLMEVAAKSIKTHLAKSRIKDLERALVKIRDTICTHLVVVLSEEQIELGRGLKELLQITKDANIQSQQDLDTSVSELIRIIKSRAWDIDQDERFSSFSSDLKTFISDAQTSSKALKVLGSLHFRQLKERHFEICEAHRNTFEWIFDIQSPINFSSWLQEESGIYWIEGKPGSGKSTLMKFLLHDARTSKILQRWSRSQPLIIIEHFFWSAGTTLQKSQAGLFRTLLFQIFSQCPELISQVCPERWHQDLAQMGEEAWDRTELFEAFVKISSLQDLMPKICFFIDGLDEYNGDHVELIEILQTMAKSPQIKICASSRPWYDFIDAFGGQEWKLSVQDLTANDILLYVKDNLEQDARFQKLESQDRIAATELVEEIRKKSYGVFLWVYLVVRSLLRGLRNRDKISDLRRRLYELPSELETYFELMLGSIEKVYQQRTARIFKIMITAQGTLPIIAFHFLDQEESEPDYALHDFISVPEDELETVIEEKKRQLHASCRDLLWVAPPDPAEDNFFRHRVGFLHRTVIDFLQTNNMDTLLSTRAGSSFQSTTSLSMIYLAMFKTHAIGVQDLKAKHSLILGVLHYAHQTESETEHAEEAVLDNLQLFTQSVDWSVLSSTPDCSTLQSLMVRIDMRLYVSKKFKYLGEEQAWNAGQILREGLRSSIVIEQDLDFSSHPQKYVDLSMLQHLLMLEISPNVKMPASDKSVWYDFLLSLETDFRKKAQDPAWDMNLYLDPLAEQIQYPEDEDYGNEIKRSKAVWLPNWNEACELMVSAGANSMMHILKADATYPIDRYLYTKNVFNAIFPPEQAQVLERLSKYKEPEKYEEPQKGKWSKLANLFVSFHS